MNRDHRRIIHELAQVYGIESVSYDNEPKRNVVITAVKYVMHYFFFKSVNYSLNNWMFLSLDQIFLQCNLQHAVTSSRIFLKQFLN